MYSLSTIVRARILEARSTFGCFRDFQKALDSTDHELLNFKSLNAGIDGKFYNSLKAIYQNPVSCVQVNDYKTGWFPTPFGVKQGDVLSPPTVCTLHK